MFDKIKNLIAAMFAAFTIKHDPLKRCSYNTHQCCSHVDGFLCDDGCGDYPKTEDTVRMLNKAEFDKSCQDWDNRTLGASEAHARRASQEDDDALQDALGLPRKTPKDKNV